MDTDMIGFVDSLNESYDDYEEYTKDLFLEDVKVAACGCVDEYILESSVSSFLQKTLGKVKTFFAKIMDKFNAFIERKNIKAKIENIKKKITRGGKGKEKVETVDYDKLNKLEENTVSTLEKCEDEEQVEEVMGEYRKRRDIIKSKARKVKITIASALTAAGILAKKFGSKCGKGLKKAETVIKNLYAKIKNLLSRKNKKKIEKMSSNPDSFAKDVDGDVENVVREVSSAIMEINRDAAQDAMESINNAVDPSNIPTLNIGLSISYGDTEVKEVSDETDGGSENKDVEKDLTESYSMLIK